MSDERGYDLDAIERIYALTLPQGNKIQEAHRKGWKEEFDCMVLNAAPAMIRDLRAMRAMLKQVEWIGRGVYCVFCGGKKTEKHRPDCALSKLIGGDHAG